MCFLDIASDESHSPDESESEDVSTPATSGLSEEVANIARIRK